MKFDRYEQALNHLRPAQANKILDGGCREGIFIQRCQKIGLSVIGVDISRDALNRSECKGQLICADLTNLPFKDQYFDELVLLDVIEHFDKEGRLKCLKELNRVLCKEGIIIISTPNSFSRPTYMLWTVFRGLFLNGGFRGLKANWFCGNDHCSVLNPLSVNKVFSKCGFRVEKNGLALMIISPNGWNQLKKKLLYKIYLGSLLWCIARKLA